VRQADRRRAAGPRLLRPADRRENLRFFGEVYGLSGATLDERVKWCLDFVGLTDRKDDRAGGIPAA
jgi:ABC-type multidrug transport system ATPase subunit